MDNAGNTTDIDFGFSSATGTDSYNGPAGPTDVGPSSVNVFNTDVDTAALGLLGGSLAGPFDFYVTSRFEIQGLDPTKQYNLTFYGSHKFSNDATTRYSVYSDNTYSSLVASTTLNVMDPLSPWLHNRDTVATLNNLTPQAGNLLYVSFVGANGGDYLNALQIKVVPEPASAFLLLGGLTIACVSRRRR